MGSQSFLTKYLKNLREKMCLWTLYRIMWITLELQNNTKPGSWRNNLWQCWWDWRDTRCGPLV